MTQDAEKLRGKIAHLKTKMADISSELEQSQQDCQVAWPTRQYRQELNYL